MIRLLASLDFYQPLWLLLALQPLLLWLILGWLQKRNQQQFADEDLLAWVKVPTTKSFWQRVFSRDTAYLLAWLGFALALAGPRIPDENKINKAKAKHDVMLVVDLSRSMHATDIAPSRIRRATLEAYEFLSIIKSARVGVVVYAARPHLYVPLTNDFNALEFYLKDLDSLQLPTHGGDPAGAILLAQKELAPAKNNQHIIWLTDGGLENQQFENIKNKVRDSSIKIHILALAAGDKVAIPSSDGTWLQSNGHAVLSESHFNWLLEITKKGKGIFAKVSDDESDWHNIYQQGILKTIATHSSRKNDKDQWNELYAWFLLPALVLLFISFFPSFRTFFILIVLSTILVFSTTVNAEERFIDNTFLEEIRQGADAYQNHKYNVAKEKFIHATLNAKTEKQRAIALHNLGNVLFQQGDYATATSLFGDALRYMPEQKQSAKNQQLAQALYKIIQRRLRNKQLNGNFTTPNQNSLLLDLPEQLPSSLNTKAVDTSEYKLPALPKDDFNRLLEKGIAHIQLLQSNSDKNQKNKKQQQKIDEARLYLLSLEEQGEMSSNPLWKRLFEIEEGFPGKLKKPKEIPGVRPW